VPQAKVLAVTDNDALEAGDLIGEPDRDNERNGIPAA
jgi:hypothetical protein